MVAKRSNRMRSRPVTQLTAGAILSALLTLGLTATVEMSDGRHITASLKPGTATAPPVDCMGTQTTQTRSNPDVKAN